MLPALLAVSFEHEDFVLLFTVAWKLGLAVDSPTSKWLSTPAGTSPAEIGALSALTTSCASPAAWAEDSCFEDFSIP